MTNGRSVLGACALVALTLACRRPPPDEQEARAAVQRYNEALVRAFRVGSADPLRDVAGPEEVERVARVIATLAERGQQMDARQVESRVVRVTPARRGDAVTLLEAVERWEYEHRDVRRPGSRPQTKGAFYRISYTLVRRGERLVVWELTSYEVPPAER